LGIALYNAIFVSNGASKYNQKKRIAIAVKAIIATIGKKTVLARVSTTKIDSPIFRLTSLLAYVARILVIPTPKKSRGKTNNANVNKYNGIIHMAGPRLPTDTIS
jgi:hypothetical protein